MFVHKQYTGSLVSTRPDQSSWGGKRERTNQRSPTRNARIADWGELQVRRRHHHGYEQGPVEPNCCSKQDIQPGRSSPSVSWFLLSNTMTYYILSLLFMHYLRLFFGGSLDVVYTVNLIMPRTLEIQNLNKTPFCLPWMLCMHPCSKKGNQSPLVDR